MRRLFTLPVLQIYRCPYPLCSAGNLSIAIQGANFPGADVNGILVPTTASSRKRSRIEGRSGMAERGLSSFVGNAIDCEFCSFFLRSIRFMVQDIAYTKSLNSALSSLNSFNKSKTDDFSPVSVDKSATIFNKNLSCGDADLSVDVSVDGQANAQASLVVAAQGVCTIIRLYRSHYVLISHLFDFVSQTIVPPALTNFQVSVGFNANIAGTANLDAGIEASFSTGQIEIFTIGIPGLDFPGYVHRPISFRNRY